MGDTNTQVAFEEPKDKRTRSQKLMDLLAEQPAGRWDPPKEAVEEQPAATQAPVYVEEVAPTRLPLSVVQAVYMEDYFRELGRLPDSAMLLGKVSDGLPFLLDLDDPEHGQLIHVMSDNDGRSLAYLKSVAAIIDYQFQPFVKSTYAAFPRSKYFGKMEYAVVTAHPEDWQGELRRTQNKLHLLDAKKRGCLTIDPVLTMVTQTWGMRNNPGFLLVDRADDLAELPDSRPLIEQLMALSEPLAHAQVRIVMSTNFRDGYNPPEYVTPIYGTTSTCPPGRLKVREGDHWLEFDVIQPSK
jgi:hypothetical protein